jgi:hypothetical protein
MTFLILTFSEHYSFISKGDIMKIFFTLCILLLINTAYAYTYKCTSYGKFAYDGVLYDGYGKLTIDGQKVKLEAIGTNATCAGDIFTYDIAGKVTGTGKVAGLMKAKLNFEESKYCGDRLGPIYFDEDLLTGGHKLKNGKLGGVLVFAGHGYSWDYNICQSLE